MNVDCASVSNCKHSINKRDAVKSVILIQLLLKLYSSDIKFMSLATEFEKLDTMH